VLAETTDHLNWELMSLAAESADKQTAEFLRAAVEEVEDEADEHLYHSTGWTRELWLQSLGMKAVLPPPEEQKNVTTVSGALEWTTEPATVKIWTLGLSGTGLRQNPFEPEGAARDVR